MVFGSKSKAQLQLVLKHKLIKLQINKFKIIPFIIGGRA
jgi:hypothetical protein